MTHAERKQTKNDFFEINTKNFGFGSEILGFEMSVEQGNAETDDFSVSGNFLVFIIGNSCYFLQFFCCSTLFIEIL